jgi:hypothetical protein
MAIGIFTLRQQLRGLLSTNWPGAKTPYVEYLVVGGGGGGGGNIAGGGAPGGGGAGGVLTGLLPVTAGVSYVTTVGGGGAGAATTGNNGNNSGFSYITAIGGGGGGSSYGNGPGNSGGSGGGGAYNNYSGGAGVLNQGNNGGLGLPNVTVTGGGGGGAGTVGMSGTGSSATTGKGGDGGSGIASAISGSVAVYGGGGGGGKQAANGLGGGTGGVGGGGDGTQGVAVASPGQANTGGGGGGTGNNYNGAAGGSGIVIISYPDSYAALTSSSNLGNAYTTGSGSLSFGNTSGTRVVYGTGYSSAWSLGTGDYTIEAFVNLQSDTVNTAAILSTGSWALRAGTTVASTIFSPGGIPYTSSINLSYNTWTHIAAVRSGGTTYLFVNGAQGFALSNGSNLNTSAELVVGDVAALGNNWSGYLSNIRIIKGTGLYTSAFTPPTAPLTPVTNTTLLLSTVSGSPYADSSVTSAVTNSASSVVPSWQPPSPFATGLGYKNRVYIWNSSGSFTI